MKIAFITDEHYPWQDEHARSVALKIVQAFKPDELIVGSDGLDFYSLSVYEKDPAILKGDGLQRQIEKWVAGQKEWTSAAPTAKKRYLPGNHEDRLRRYLWAHPEISDLEVLKLSSLLKFDVCGIAGEPEKEIVYYDQLAVRHGSVVRQKSGQTALGELEKDRFALSTMTGHTHRGGTVYTTVRGEVRQAQECFCLCKLEANYGGPFDWQQGIVLATVKKDLLSIEPVPFFRSAGKVAAHWRGKAYHE